MVWFSGHGVLGETTPATTNAPTSVILVVGATGEDEYGAVFGQAATNWQQACLHAQAKCHSIGLAPTNQLSDLEQLKTLLQNEPPTGSSELWLVLIGHGSFDGHEAKFNLRGPDLSATELAAWLKPLQRPLAVINAASSSAPFMNQLSGTNRVIITATSSGYEQNYARFGHSFAETIQDPQADLDKDGQTSLLEAFLTAANRVAEFYHVEGRLATEHALLDDNGDGQGTPADWFRGLRAAKKPNENAALDGLRAHQFHLVRNETDRGLSPEQRARRDDLERAVYSLRDKKDRMPEEDYYRELEKLLVELSAFYQ